MKFIPLVNINAEYSFLKNKIQKAVQKTLKSADFILGKPLQEFEKNFANYIGTKYALGVASGTDALFLSLKSLNLNENDEVILPAFTFVATALAVVNCKLKPVLVDISEKDYCIDITQIKNKITNRTKAIIPVHLYGYPANMEELAKICKEYNLYLIEDACQAHGSCFNRKKAGSFGITGCFSFYPSKNLGAYGDAGMITTNNDKIYDYLKALRNLGHITKYEHIYLGINSRLDSIQATILNVKLPYLDKWNAQRRKKANIYRKLLKKLPVILPPEDTEKTFQTFHLFVIRTQEREKLYEYLKTNNIGVIIHYPKPLHLQNSFQKFFKEESYPVAEKVSKEVLSLPLNPFIKKEEITYVCKKIKEFFKREGNNL